MQDHTDVVRGSHAIVAGGGALAGLAVAHHYSEIATLNGSVGPVAALAIDGGFALVLVVIGYRLSQSDLDVEHGWRIAAWGLVGAAVAVGMVGLSMVIRAAEGRVISEPSFTLLLATDIGAIAGVTAGYYRMRSVRATRQFEEAASGLAFVNGVIRHDLRNDLQVIDGYAERLSIDPPSDPDELRDGLDIISRRVEDAHDRIAETEVIAETLIGEVPIERIDLVPIVDDVVQSAERTYGVSIDVDTADAAPVRANEGVRSVVDNLVENAIEHNDRDEPAVTVGVTTSDETIRLTVQDDGPGLTDEEKAAALESAVGSGGGLQIAATLVDRYGGELRIEDNEPRGAVFVVVLPRADGAD